MFKAFPTWKTPVKLLVVTPAAHTPAYKLMMLAALQGIINRNAVDGTYMYLDMNEATAFWLDRYNTKLGGNAITNLSEQQAFTWAKQRSLLRGYVMANPAKPWTLNICTTIAGLTGNVVPATPEWETWLKALGLSLIPSGIPSNGDRLSAYTWALKKLRPLCHNQAFHYNCETTHFSPLTLDWAVAQKSFVHFLSVLPTSPDYPLFQEMLFCCGAGSQMRGWDWCAGKWDEGAMLHLLSTYKCYHGGSAESKNATVHAAMSQLYPSSYAPRPVLELDPNLAEHLDGKVLITNTLTDGDQPAVWEDLFAGANRVPMLSDPMRGTIPINWGINPTLYHLGRGILDYARESLATGDSLPAWLPYGYANFRPEYFGAELDAYLTEANIMIGKCGLTAAFFCDDGRGLLDTCGQAVLQRIQKLANVETIVDGYHGSDDLTVYRREEQPETVYVRAYSFMGGWTGRIQNAVDAARAFHQGMQKTHVRPQFAALNWSNWDHTPSDIREFFNALENLAPGVYHAVGLLEFRALIRVAYNE